MAVRTQSRKHLFVSLSLSPCVSVCEREKERFVFTPSSFSVICNKDQELLGADFFHLVPVFGVKSGTQ